MNVKAAKNKVFLYRNFVCENTEKRKKLLPAALEKIDSISIATINPANVKKTIRRFFNYYCYLIVYGNSLIIDIIIDTQGMEI